MNFKKLLFTCCLISASGLSVSAQPTVVTDTRFARGATMAFGRISSETSNGATITSRGFCLSESPEPTIDDILSTKTISNNGMIYYFENLKPSTKYYMRAYAKNSKGVGYGKVIKFYTLPMGAITASYNNGGNAAENERINSAVDNACFIFSNLTSIKKHFNIGYGSGTPTADCNYQDTPWMNVGPNASYQRTGTIMHEMEHGLGVIPYSTQWAGNILRAGNGTGNWLGDRTSAFLDFWDNTTGSFLKGDTQHMWPYGINGASEDDGSLKTYYANAMIAQALGEDGLEHTYSTYADPCYIFDYEEGVKYYLKNEDESRGLYDSYLVEDGAKKLKWVAMTPDEIAADDAAAWYISFTPDNQYYQLRNAKTGNYITYSAGFKTATRNNGPLSADNLHLMKSRVDLTLGTTSRSFTTRGYWFIHPTSGWSPQVLGAGTNGAVNQPTFDRTNTATMQRWLILTEAEARKMESVSLGGMKASFKSLLNQYKAFLDVPHTENEASADDTFRGELSGFETEADAARTPEAIETLETSLRTAALSFLGKVSVTDLSQPFDLTMLLANPDFSEDMTSWGINSEYTCNAGLAEVYESKFNCYQRLQGMPAGTYEMRAQAFHRPGTAEAVYADYMGGNDKASAMIFFGRNTNTKVVKNIMAERQTSALYPDDVKLDDGTYVPNSMAGTAAYFANGLYENSISYTSTNAGGQLMLGIRCNEGTAGSAYWCIFDNFRLYFYGGNDALTGIEESTKEQVQSTILYDLQGRKVLTPTRGIYILNGKKVLIK